ncbi:hypothetical protein [Brachybacterium phenoliresistens]|uniref:Uncharacterized protein n=1 Tax=Brachybacterium phenoliresistens TaxID=396014 RepID=Z9JVQ9_9MICO|nr:hypothetical protein [Brachybacterium phenoliresistens]EWS82058.1 hypothetical protein BF93_13695 [Brachybacterium phenoliresistens]
MTFWHLILLVVGILAAIASADALRHRGIGVWPVGILALALVFLAGWTYSAWLSALSLGAAAGVGIVLVATMVRGISLRRRDRRAARAAQDEALRRRLEDRSPG